MGEDEIPQSPEMQATPAAPTVGQLTSDAMSAQASAFDQSLPQLERFAQSQTDIQGRQAPQLLEQFIKNQSVGGPALIGLALDRVKQADPSGFALRESLMQRVAENLSQGGAYSDAEKARLKEDFRQAQVNRGFGTGLSDALDEANFLEMNRFNREQARIANAMQVLSGRGPMDSMGQMQGLTPFGTQDVSGMASNLIPSTTSLMGFGMGAAGMNAANIANANNMKQHQFEWGQANKSNPLKEDIMFGLEVGKGVGQIAGGIAGAAMGNPMAGMGAMGGASNLAGTVSQGSGGRVSQPTMSWNQPYY